MQKKAALLAHNCLLVKVVPFIRYTAIMQSSTLPHFLKGSPAPQFYQRMVENDRAQSIQGTAPHYLSSIIP